MPLCKVLKYGQLHDQLNLAAHFVILPVLTHELCRQYDTLCIEDLQLTGMSRLWGRKMADLAFGSEFQQGRSALDSESPERQSS